MGWIYHPTQKGLNDSSARFGQALKWRKIRWCFRAVKAFLCCAFIRTQFFYNVARHLLGTHPKMVRLLQCSFTFIPTGSLGSSANKKRISEMLLIMSGSFQSAFPFPKNLSMKCVDFTLTLPVSSYRLHCGDDQFPAAGEPLEHQQARKGRNYKRSHSVGLWSNLAEAAFCLSMCAVNRPILQALGILIIVSGARSLFFFELLVSSITVCARYILESHWQKKVESNCGT